VVFNEVLEPVQDDIDGHEMTGIESQPAPVGKTIGVGETTETRQNASNKRIFP